MTLIVIPQSSISYQCESSDIVGGKVPSANYIGASVYVTDTKQWYRVMSDLTLVELFINTTTSGSAGHTAVVLQDTSGCAISSFVNLGDNYLETAIIQEVHESTLNSGSGMILTSGSIWIGQGQSTLGAGAIQVAIAADQNMTVFIDQSVDNINWDIVDSFAYLYVLGGDARTFQAIASYFRIRVRNDGYSSNTFIRLQSLLAPIISTEPKSLTSGGNFKTAVYEMLPTFGTSVQSTPSGMLRTADSTRLSGGIFAGSALDANYWLLGSVAGGGGVSLVGGAAVLTTGSVANGSVGINSIRSARYVSGRSNYCRMVIKNQLTSGCVTKRWGAYDVNDGYFFEYSGSNVSVCSRKSGSDLKIASGSFNGSFGDVYVLDNLAHIFEITWSNSNTWFSVDGNVFHRISGSSATLVSTPSLKIGLECINTGGNTYVNTLECRSASISRSGALLTQPTSSYTSGQVAAKVLKNGTGNLHSAIIGSSATTSVITLYDGISASGSVIFSYTYTQGSNANNSPVSLDFKGLPFFAGLTLSIGTANSNVTVIYE